MLILRAIIDYIDFGYVIVLLVTQLGLNVMVGLFRLLDHNNRLLFIRLRKLGLWVLTLNATTSKHIDFARIILHIWQRTQFLT